MNTTGFVFGGVCAVSVGLISLISSHLYRRVASLSSELMALVSFAPGFALGLYTLTAKAMPWTAAASTAIVVKNVFYGLSFYYRYESLRKFGPFVGALMLGTQPVIIFLLGLIVLGESLAIHQIASLLLTSLALVLLAGSRDESGRQRIGFRDFSRYYVLPTLAAATAVIWDRYFLRGKVGTTEFFTMDRILMLPAFFIAIFLIKPREGNRAFDWNRSVILIIKHWIPMLAIAVLFTLSVYSYNLALTFEKASMVGLLRNSAYPVAALASVFLFKHEVRPAQWVSFGLVCSAVLIAVI